jgi:protein-L-isoaspartate(D-aspartate) O-methyltransferase
VPRRPDDDATRGLREQLVDALRSTGALSDDRVAAAFRSVPRHIFLPATEPAQAYRDAAIVTKQVPDGRPISSSSQPAIMAIMLEQLAVEPGQRVLEIGAGTGYNAALLAHLAGEGGSVVTVDLDEDLVADAKAQLAACGVEAVAVVQSDGALGWPPAAPYDRIILTVGAWDLAPAWVDQLAPTGRLVLPLSLRGFVQRSIAFERANGHLSAASIRACGFMRMRGAFAGPETVLALGPEPGVFVEFGELGEQGSVDPDALPALLAQPGTDVRSGVEVGPSDLRDGLDLWLALHEPRIGAMTAIGAAADQEWLPTLVRMPGEAGTAVLLGPAGCAALVRLAAAAKPGSFEVGVRPFGAQGGELADRLVAHLRAWAAAGRPVTADLRISAYPAGATTVDDTAIVIDKRHTRLALTWRIDQR